jgi:hypothetical protein
LVDFCPRPAKTYSEPVGADGDQASEEKVHAEAGRALGQIPGAVVGGELGGYIAEGTQFGLGTLLLRYSRDYEKQADLLGAQIMAPAGYDPRALAHAPSRSASIRLNKTATWFQMALFWSTNSILLIAKSRNSAPNRELEPDTPELHSLRCKSLAVAVPMRRAPIASALACRCPAQTRLRSAR